MSNCEKMSLVPNACRKHLKQMDNIPYDDDNPKKAIRLVEGRVRERNMIAKQHE